MTPPADDHSPSEKTLELIRRQRLHPITWLLIIATAVNLLSDTAYTFADLQAFLRDGADYRGHPTSAGLLAAGIAHDYAYSILWFGTAATVEFLFRIWGELRLRRNGGA